jgi:hypothetical protein
MKKVVLGDGETGVNYAHNGPVWWVYIVMEGSCVKG